MSEAFRRMSLLFQSTLPARGATLDALDKRIRVNLFQSTLPARGATATVSSTQPIALYFNPRSPHGERLRAADHDGEPRDISIHAPRTGSDRWA